MTGVPNTFQCFNAYVDKAMELLTDAELRCLLFATRHIMGWQDKINERQGVISLSMFEHGFVSKEGVRFAGCGLRRPAIQKAVTSLAEYGFLKKAGEVTPDGQQWQLAETGIEWKKLEARHYEKTAKGIKQVEKAVAASAEKRRSEQGGTLDVPVRETYQQEYVRRTDTGTLDVQNQTHIQNQYQTHTAPNGAGVDLSEKITYLEPDTPPNPPTPISAPPPSPRKRNPMFDAVAEHIFKIDGDQLPDEMPDGLIGAVSAWLEGKSDGMRQGRKKLVVGKISRPAEPQHVRMFAEDWQRDHPGASMPLSFEKIVNHWRAWASKKNGARVTVPAHQPIVIPDDIELTPEEAADIKAQARKATA